MLVSIRNAAAPHIMHARPGGSPPASHAILGHCRPADKRATIDYAPGTTLDWVDHAYDIILKWNSVPLYEYQCIDNHHSFDVRHGINEEPVRRCPECGSEVRRVIHPVGLVFKGSGFYVNDSRKAAAPSKPADPEAKKPAKKDGKQDDGPAAARAKPDSQPKAGAPNT